MRSAYLNYDDFRRPVEAAIKLSRACFGHFECTFSETRINDCNYSGKKYLNISRHSRSVFKYFRNYTHFVEGATRLTTGRSIKAA